MKHKNDTNIFGENRQKKVKMRNRFKFRWQEVSKLNWKQF
jgi:hypothetical protein